MRGPPYGLEIISGWQLRAGCAGGNNQAWSGEHKRNGEGVMTRSRYVAIGVSIAAYAIGCAKPPAPTASDKSAKGPANETAASETATPAAVSPAQFEKIGAKYLPNAIRLHEKVISGGQPDGEPAFEELAALGVKTVISVDGATPEVELAKKHGLRYVHLPHGYDGIPEERAEQLAKAVRDLPGPNYTHCHHGKHRSPAAATVACVATGLIQPSDALAVLKVAGTSENYRGLYQSAENARRLDDALLDALLVEFHETEKIPLMAEAMVAVEHTFDHVKQIAAAGWRPPAEHPDIDPPHEVLLLREHFTELLRTDEVQKQPERFRQLLTESETAATELEAALRAATDAMPADLKVLTEKFDVISKHCTACHREFRDVPLGEKQRTAADASVAEVCDLGR
jgi:protein tyrosine phosphatase (PTP) superfamily phosphohydrolase (DUF442 family)